MAQGMVIIEADRCKGCGLCIDVCGPHILQLSAGTFNVKGYRPIEVTDMDKCTGCGLCATICPDVVFAVYRRKRKPRTATPAA